MFEYMQTNTRTHTAPEDFSSPPSVAVFQHVCHFDGETFPLSYGNRTFFVDIWNNHISPVLHSISVQVVSLAIFAFCQVTKQFPLAIASIPFGLRLLCPTEKKILCLVKKNLTIEIPTLLWEQASFSKNCHKEYLKCRR